MSLTIFTSEIASKLAIVKSMPTGNGSPNQNMEMRQMKIHFFH